MKEQFRKADTNRSGFLSFKEVKELCHRLNVKMKKDDLERMFDQANTNKEDKTPIWKERGGQVLNEEEFVTFYYNLMRREEIDELFDKYSEKVIAVRLKLLCCKSPARLGIKIFKPLIVKEVKE